MVGSGFEGAPHLCQQGRPLYAQRDFIRLPQIGVSAEMRVELLQYGIPFKPRLPLTCGTFCDRLVAATRGLQPALLQPRRQSLRGWCDGSRWRHESPGGLR